MQKRTKGSITLFLLLIFAVCSAQALANGKRLLDKETFMDMESVSNAAISPDGKQIVFTRTWVNKMKDQYRSNIWIVDSRRLAPARIDSRQLARQLSRLVARRPPHSLHLGPRQHVAVARHVG